MKKTDVFIKHEGHADIRLRTDAVKTFCTEQGFYNQLEQMGDTFCGEPVWTEKSPKGVFHLSVETAREAREVAEYFEENGFKVESEF